jgi:hypothetical protein
MTRVRFRSKIAQKENPLKGITKIIFTESVPNVLKQAKPCRSYILTSWQK